MATDNEARIKELESQLATAQTTIESLKKEKESIFYTWTKEDFLVVVEDYVTENEEYSFSETALEALWNIWKREFEKRFCASNTIRDMMAIMEDIMEENKKSFTLAAKTE